VAGALYYHLYVSGPGGAVVLDQWYEALTICNSGDICSVASPILGGGEYGWYVQAWNPAGYGLWSNDAQPTKFNTTITLPGAADLTYPEDLADPVNGKDIGTDYNPTYTWVKVADVTWYRLYVSGPSGVALDQWYKAVDICDNPDAGVCAVLSPTLGAGAHVWYVQTYGPAGYGLWSNGAQPTKFYTAVSVPAVVVLQNPAAGDNLELEYNPTYTWGKSAGATYYRVYVSGPSGVVLDQWYLASSVCKDTVNDTCTIGSMESPTPTLAGGEYSWYVQAYSPAGYGLWSNGAQPTKFYTNGPIVLPAAATLTLPTPGGTTTSHVPTYTWKKVNMAVWYHLYVKGPGGVVKDQWYQAATICASSTCSVVSPSLEYGNHTWWIQTYSLAGYGPWKSATFKVIP
jgi:hypothetical protein